MTREEIAHIVRAAANITGETEFVLIGSQALVAQLEVPPAEQVLAQSMELDLYPRYRPDLSDDIDGMLGFDSQFHRTFGISADGVGPETAVLPDGWETRLHPVRLDSMRRRDGAAVTAWALDPNDLLVSKYAAAREKDLAFAAAALRLGLAETDIVERRLGEARVPLSDEKLQLARASLKAARENRRSQ